jgi:hypothetical protein
MAIKYFVDEKNKKTVAVLEGCRWDACNHIQKMLRCGNMDESLLSYRPYFMPDTLRAVVTCSELDQYDVEEGKRLAKKKLMEHYSKSVEKRVKQYQQDLLRIVEVLKV